MWKQKNPWHIQGSSLVLCQSLIDLASTAHVIVYNLEHMFQIDMATEDSSSNNEAICLELLGVLRRCFMQQADVRLRLYEGELH
jgi:hypothetical protein